jgi:hypothetical protein
LFSKSSPKHPLEVDGEASPQNIAKYILSLGDKQLVRELMVLGLRKFADINTAVRIRANVDTSLGPEVPGAATGAVPKKTTKLAAVSAAAPQGEGRRFRPRSNYSAEWIASMREDERFEGKTSEEKAVHLDRNVEELKKVLQSTTARSLNEHAAAGTEPPITTLGAIEFSTIGAGSDKGHRGRGPGGGGRGRTRGRGWGRAPSRAYQDYTQGYDNSQIECYRCGGIGHPSHKCWNAFHQVTHEPLLWADQMPTVAPAQGAPGTAAANTEPAATNQSNPQGVN